MYIKISPLLLAVVLLAACSEIDETPDSVSADVDLESLNWVEDKTEITVSLYDASGRLIDNKQDVQNNKEYDVKFEASRPVAIYIKSNYGLRVITDPNKVLPIRDVHEIRVLKIEPGFNQLIFEIYPLYYLNGELTRERPQVFVFPKD